MIGVTSKEVRNKFRIPSRRWAAGIFECINGVTRTQNSLMKACGSCAATPRPAGNVINRLLNNKVRREIGRNRVIESLPSTNRPDRTAERGIHSQPPLVPWMRFPPKSHNGRHSQRLHFNLCVFKGFGLARSAVCAPRRAIITLLYYHHVNQAWSLGCGGRPERERTTVGAVYFGYISQRGYKVRRNSRSFRVENSFPRRPGE